MKYWVYIDEEIKGPFDSGKLAELENFTGATLVSPQAQPGDAVGAWQAASGYPELAAALAANGKR